MTDTMADVVNAGVYQFADLEEGLLDLQAIAGDLIPIIDRGQALGMATALAAAELRARVIALKGKLADVESATLSLHRECTRIAQRNGVDVPDPQSGGLRDVE